MTTYKEICIGGPMHGHRVDTYPEEEGETIKRVEWGRINFPVINTETLVSLSDDPLMYREPLHNTVGYIAHKLRIFDRDVIFWVWDRLGKVQAEKLIADYILFPLEK